MSRDLMEDKEQVSVCVSECSGQITRVLLN